MKINHEIREIQSEGISDCNSFSIKASAHAFRILSDGLYSDKILAIVRELYCNALDSHKAAGCEDVPVTVHVPNTIEPWFSVIDRGIGLSHNQIMKLYTTYFESTKSDSNDFIGALGLGSKSPFSYTDTFTVISDYEGQRRIYGAFLGENGTPSIALLTQEDLKQDTTGIEVRVPIKSNDFSSIERKVLTFFEGIPHPIKIVGNDLEVLEPVIRFQGEGWRIVTQYNSDEQTLLNYSGGWNSPKTFAFMGAVRYPVSARNISESNFSDYPIIKKLLDLNGLEIMFDIGDLEVAASREQLGFDNRTQKKIVDRVLKIHNEINDYIQNHVDQAETYWDACIAKTQAIKNVYGSLSGNDGDQYIWGGQIVNRRISFEAENVKDTPIGTIWSVTPLKVSIRRKCIFTAKTPEETPKKILAFNAQPNTIFFFSDMTLSQADENRRIRLFVNGLKDNAGNSFYLVEREEEHLTNFLTKIGNPPVIRIADLPQPERVKMIRTPKPKAPEEQKIVLRTYNFDGYRGWRGKDRDMWMDAQYDDSITGYYVVMERMNVVTKRADGTDSRTLTDYSSLFLDALSFLGHTKPPKLLSNNRVIDKTNFATDAALVWGESQTAINRLKKQHPDVKELFEACWLHGVKTFGSERNFVQMIVNKNTNSGYPIYHSDVFRDWIASNFTLIETVLDQDSAFLKGSRKVKEFTDTSRVVKHIGSNLFETLKQLYSEHFVDVESNFKIVDEFLKIVDVYPLLRTQNQNLESLEKDKTHIINYIRMVDSGLQQY